MDTIPLFAAQYKEIFVMIHLFAMVLGLGGATYSDILLLRFLKDLRISKKEAEVIHTMSQVILVGIVLAFLSGSMLFFADPARLAQSPKFIAKLIAFTILTVNGFLLHHVVLPKLLQFSFHKDVYHGQQVLHLRQVGVIMGAISAVSWYMVFIMGSFRSFPLTLGQLLGIYFGIMAAGICCVLCVENHVKKKLKNSVKKKKE